jgi:hypothetical protein
MHTLDVGYDINQPIDRGCAFPAVHDDANQVRRRSIPRRILRLSGIRRERIPIDQRDLLCSRAE